MNTFARLKPPEQIRRTASPLHGYLHRTDIVVGTGPTHGTGAEIFRLSHPALAGLNRIALGEIATRIARAIQDAHATGFDQGRALVADALNLRDLISQRVDEATA